MRASEATIPSISRHDDEPYQPHYTNSQKGRSNGNNQSKEKILMSARESVNVADFVGVNKMNKEKPSDSLLLSYRHS
jgi:hypothetical protein